MRKYNFQHLSLCKNTNRSLCERPSTIPIHVLQFQSTGRAARKILFGVWVGNDSLGFMAEGQTFTIGYEWKVRNGEVISLWSLDTNLGYPSNPCKQTTTL
ncbi:hypothetical protein FRX31_034098 [Thalictrum thalictroides]|uniref:Uncharacterized protein n=1 Tax=Thalictrum thalictroides TaxID=46969 RepID=A0A7J6UUN9_THATH|nr:hypothetical protein FRX31_034098 [Thalictrum thalictroides]